MFASTRLVKPVGPQELARLLRRLGSLNVKANDGPDQDDVVRHVPLDQQLDLGALVLELLRNLGVVVVQHLGAARLDEDGRLALERVAEVRHVGAVGGALARAQRRAAPVPEAGHEVVAVRLRAQVQAVVVQRRADVNPRAPEPDAPGPRQAEVGPVLGDVAQQAEREVAAGAVAGDGDARGRHAQLLRQVHVRRDGVLQRRGEAPAGVAREAVLRRQHVGDAPVLQQRAREEARVAVAAVAHDVGPAVEVQHDVDAVVDLAALQRLRRPGRAERLRGDGRVEQRALVGKAVRRRLQDDEAVGLAARGERERGARADGREVAQEGLEDAHAQRLAEGPARVRAREARDVEQHPQREARGLEERGQQAVDGLEGLDGDDADHGCFRWFWIRLSEAGTSKCADEDGRWVGQPAGRSKRVL
jgi:hypothetical protein